MIKQFLTAKHWQLFLLFFGIPFILQMIFMGNMFSQAFVGSEPNPDSIFTFFQIFIVVMVILMGTLLGWMASIGIGLDKNIPDHLKLNLTRFKIFISFPIVYIVLLFSSMGMMMNGIVGEAVTPNPAVFMLIIPLHFFAMFCMFYSLYFVAKTIKTAEVQQEVSFGDFIGEFFLIWFYPVGIWVIQPRVNKLYQEAAEFE